MKQLDNSLQSNVENKIKPSICYEWWCTEVNSVWDSKALPTLNVISDRQHAFAQFYWHDYDIWHKVWIEYNIQPEVMVCIARADSHLWYELKSSFNYGNVGNNDRWDVVHYANAEQGIRAIARVLNTKYLWTKQTIGDLSMAGDCKINCSKAYATSKENRQNNVLNCMSMMRNIKTNHDYRFRL